MTYGPSVTVGYYNNPEANARSFNADGWFATGDIGILEEVLYQHPKVLEAAAVGIPDPRLGERVCACIVPRPGESLTQKPTSA